MGKGRNTGEEQESRFEELLFFMISLFRIILL